MEMRKWPMTRSNVQLEAEQSGGRGGRGKSTKEQKGEKNGGGGKFGLAGGREIGVCSARFFARGIVLTGARMVCQSRFGDNARTSAQPYHIRRTKTNSGKPQETTDFLANLLNDARPKTFHIFSSRFQQAPSSFCVDSSRRAPSGRVLTCVNTGLWKGLRSGHGIGNALFRFHAVAMRAHGANMKKANWWIGLLGLLGAAASWGADNLYMVVDMSGGLEAATWPVSYLSGVPSGGWDYDHKTSKLVLRRIEKGTFTMGSPRGEFGRADDETQHKVTLTKDYYIGVFEFTQQQWMFAMSENPSEYSATAAPVENVNYKRIRGGELGAEWPAGNDVDANSFLAVMRAKTGLAFDLPTEAQWEYACRGGTTTALNSGKNLTSEVACPNMDEVGRYYYNQYDGKGGYSAHTTVGNYAANNWGLYDMHGNIGEWCLDWWGTYDSGSVTNPVGPDSSDYDWRVNRGGCWNDDAEDCRSARRNGMAPNQYMDFGRKPGLYIGFRLACADPSTQKQTVTFDTHGGICPTATKTYAIATTYGSLPTASRKGYSFNGWSTDEDGGHAVTVFSIVTDESTRTLHAQWTPGEQVVTFNANGGECWTASRGYTIGTQYNEFPPAERDGYAFNGWFTAPSGGTLVTTESTVTTDSTRTLFAHWTLTRQTVTFNANGGNCSAEEEDYVVGESYGYLPDATRSDAIFVGWWTEATGGTLVTATNIVPSVAIQTLYAHWTTEQTLVFDANGGVCEIETKACTMGQTYGSLPEATRSDHIFLGWWTELDEGTQVTDESLATMDLVYTLHAHWAMKQTVLFNPNGGFCEMSSKTCVSGEPYGTLPVAMRDGYSFAGWSTMVDGGEIVTAESTVPANLTWTLYARWIPIFHVQFNANGGSGKMPEQTFIYDTPQPLTDNLFVREGYEFAGWATHSSGPVEYWPGWAVSNLVATPNGVVQLYALWYDKTTLERHGLGVLYWYYPRSSSSTDTWYDTVSTWAGLRSHYSPNYYYDDATCTDLRQANLDSMALRTWTLEENGELWAAGGFHAEETGPYQFSIDYDGECALHINKTLVAGGIENATAHGTVNLSAGWHSISIAYYYTTNYKRCNVYVQSPSATQRTLIPQSLLCPELIAGGANYTVRFNANGGQGNMPMQDFVMGISQGLASNCYSRVGYQFKGWSTTPGSGEVWNYFDDRGVVSNLTTQANGIVDLYAMWNANSYCVYFDGNGGEGQMGWSEKYYDEVWTLPRNEYTMTGYTFAGWSLGDGDTVDFADGAVVSNLTAEAWGGVTLRAVWKPNANTVQFHPNGGEGTMADWQYVYDDSTTLPVNTFWRAGYRFVGWATRPGGAPTFMDGEDVSNWTEEYGAVVSLYSVWLPEEELFIGFCNDEKVGQKKLWFYGKNGVKYALQRTQDLLKGEWETTCSVFGGNGLVVWTNIFPPEWKTGYCRLTEEKEQYSYIVLDLSDGPDAKQWPIEYLSEVPPGGFNTEEYKTTKLVVRRIEPGTFMMGSPNEELGHFDDEDQHEVTITQPFFIGLFEVTQKQWELVMGGNPAWFQGNMRPVELVSYDMIRGNAKGGEWPGSSEVEAESFMGKLREKAAIPDAMVWDLPTEAQWEYACRAGSTTALNNGNNLVAEKTCSNLNAVGRYLYNWNDGKGVYPEQHTTVGSYLPNAWGLYDMHGNVWEWCLDWWQDKLGMSATENPLGASSGPGRVYRGGGCYDGARYCRSACRHYTRYADDTRGFRLARILPIGYYIQSNIEKGDER